MLLYLTKNKQNMKKQLMIATITLFTSLSIHAQDIITKRNGDEIPAKVIEVGIEEVKFKKFDNIEGPLIVIAKSDIIFIKYENGSKEIFEDIKAAVIKNNSQTPINWKFQAENDAIRYYRGYRGAQAGTFWTSLLFGPIIGLIPAIATSVKKPTKQVYLQYPNAEYFNNPEYKETYMHRAYKRKKHKVWGMYALGSGLSIGLSAFIIAASGPQ